MSLPVAQGLAPSVQSHISPEVEETMHLRWYFQGRNTSSRQASVTIILYEELNGSFSEIERQTIQGGTTSYSIQNFSHSFIIDKKYGWRIITQDQNGYTSPISQMAEFYYVRFDIGQPLNWSLPPQPYAETVKAEHFSDIKNNLNTLLNDYADISAKEYQMLSSIATENTLSFGDIEKIRAILSDFIAKQPLLPPLPSFMNTQNTVDVNLFNRIKNYIQLVDSTPPQPVASIQVGLDSESVPSPKELSVSRQGNDNQMIGLSWSKGDYSPSKTKFDYQLMSVNKRLSYYKVNYSYGYREKNFQSMLFYKASHLADRTTLTGSEVEWDEIQGVTSPYQQIEVIPVDKRGNEGRSRVMTRNYQEPFVLIQGFRRFRIETQQRSLSQTSYTVQDSNWNLVTNQTNSFYNTTLLGSARNIFYRIRTEDKSGAVSPWTYSQLIDFEPLTPPAIISNFRVTETNVNNVRLSWNAASRAEWYELRRGAGSHNTIFEGNQLTYNSTGLSANTPYTFYVKAWNRAGSSRWQQVTVRTLTGRKTSTFLANGSASWRDNWFWRTDNSNVYQGEWCEIAGSPNQSGPAGTCWGKHRGFWFFNDASIRSTLQGRRIVSVRIRIERLGTQHGYYNDQRPNFWLHNHGSRPSGNARPLVRNNTHFQTNNPRFSLGNINWITLPRFYGEHLRDNRAKGIALYNPSNARLPYLQFRGNARLEIIHEDA